MSGLHFVNISTCFVSSMPGGSRTTRPDNIVIIFPSRFSGFHCTAFLFLFFGSKLLNRTSESATSFFFNVVGKEEQIWTRAFLYFFPYLASCKTSSATDGNQIINQTQLALQRRVHSHPNNAPCLKNSKFCGGASQVSSSWTSGHKNSWCDLWLKTCLLHTRKHGPQRATW